MEELITAAERGKQPEATIYEEGSEGVRMMSVHRAKGLEFPIVILADITCAIAHDDPDRFLDGERGLCAVRLSGWLPQDVIDHAAEEHSRDEAEGIRVAYVAATRARDVLVVPAIGEDATGVGPAIAASWWVAPLYSALYPPEEKRHSPARAGMCPAFGLDSVLNRPNGEPPLEYTVRPGAHGFGSGSTAYNVVWWGPTTLELGKPPSFSIRQQELLERGDDQLVQHHLTEYQAWRNVRQKLLEHGSMPSIRFQTVTDSAKRELALDVKTEVVEMAKKTRPYGPRFGSLVHATLAAVPLGSNAPDVAAVANLQGRIFGATREEIAAAIEVAVAVLRHPLMQRARAAVAIGRCYRELPLSLRMDDGTLVEGIADVVFFDGEKWTVIDFKTDQDLASGLQRYRRQVAIYATAVSKVNEAQCEAFLFCV
ncbi:MAG TPA: 3'-5' exonuclease [Terriglobales bacterium]|nr:3'-5' exonuclease [Terriglobales bacterium]